MPSRAFRARPLRAFSLVLPAHDAAASPRAGLRAVVRRAALPLAVTASLVLTVPPAAAAPVSGPDAPATTVPSDPPTGTDRVIVKFKDAAAPAATKDAVVESAAQDALPGAKTPEVADHVKTTAAKADVVELDRELDEAEQEKVVAEIQADPAVEYAEADRLASASWVPNDTYTNFQWSLWPNQGGVSFTSAWDLSRGNGQTIAVLDTGITSHPDLNSKVVAGRDFINDPALSRDGDLRDANPQDQGDWSGAGECSSAARTSSWHGTHVAGLAAGATQNGTGIAGAAPGARIQPVRVLGKCTNGWVSDIADGISWAAGAPVAGEPANPNPATVVNLSLNYPGECGATMQNAINAAVNRSVPVVVAAGNSAVNAGGTAPANCANTIVVGASDNAGNTASYSNTGAAVDVLAPGGTAQNPLLSTVNTGTTTPAGASYANMYGTSMATPLVSGTVALMKQKNPAITPARVEQILKSTASGNLGSLTVDPAAAVRTATPAAPATSYPVSGAIGAKWRATGGAAKWGNPAGAEGAAANGGRYQEFVKDGRKTTIYWSSATGAHVVENTTLIGKKFISAGRERGYGFPTSEETRAGAGSYQVFRTGSATTKITWNSAAGTHAVRESGGIGGAWKRAGFERGWGWPTTDEYRSGTEVRQRFSNGVTAHWTAQRGVWTTR
ncbi:S8 family serine peptidase [Kocuria sp.]|uniref:S8 family serine peptidase n=1 Tax=Kocuria sp. TaxID=1871328 RepID=UPI0026DC91BE|nr:S8 family serine peptidase [Kocuria sp.]MDO4919694.1 S8 family serine peptidase [Kocuria sp.]